jgi:hypothetical protein
MGEHYVVVRPSAISFNAKDNKWHATMNANADQLKAARSKTRMARTYLKIA